MSDHSTRERILDAAEKLFTHNGFYGTSLRTITAEAGVNLAAVHYHFGSKHELLLAALRRRVEPVNAERLRRLDAAIAAAGGGIPPVEAIVDAFVRPMVEAFARIDPSITSGMLSLVHSRAIEPSFFQEVFGEVIERFGILHHVLPLLEPAEVAWRLHFTVGAMIQAFNPRVCEAHTALTDWEPDRLADAIVAFATAGFQAAPSSTRHTVFPGNGPTTEQETHS